MYSLEGKYVWQTNKNKIFFYVYLENDQTICDITGFPDKQIHFLTQNDRKGVKEL